MKKDNNPILLEKEIKNMFISLDEAVKNFKAVLDIQEIGLINSVGKGVVRANGLPNAKSGEIVTFKGGNLGIVFNLNPDSVDIILWINPKPCLLETR